MFEFRSAYKERETVHKRHVLIQANVKLFNEVNKKKNACLVSQQCADSTAQKYRFTLSITIGQCAQSHAASTTTLTTVSVINR